MQASISLLQWYQLTKQDSEKQALMTALIDEGERIVVQNKDKDAVFAASRLVANIYAGQTRWNEAARLMRSAAEKYPDDPSTAELLYFAGITYRDHCNNPTVAQQCFSTIETRFPDQWQLLKTAQATAPAPPASSN
jgi:outer membrane protein assembly factor BamD (BamD/ComL family)